MKKIIGWLKADRKRMAGMLLTLIAMVIAAFFIRSILMPDADTDAKAEKREDTKLTETERNLIIEDLNINGDDSEDVDPDVAKKIMSLELAISDEITRDVLAGEKESLKKEMEDYLVANDFYMDVTKAVCTQEVTKNYLTKEIYMEFKLNDPARTIVSVQFRQGSSRFSFNFY